MILFSLFDFKKYVTNCKNEQEIVKASLDFLEEHTIISNICYKLLTCRTKLTKKERKKKNGQKNKNKNKNKKKKIQSNKTSNIFNIPMDLINIIIDYVVKKADPQEILDTCILWGLMSNYYACPSRYYAYPSRYLDVEDSCESKYFSIQCYNFKQLKKFILEGWDINKLGYYYKNNIANEKITPLMFACTTRNYNLINFYLTEGANPNINDDYGHNSLFNVLVTYLDVPRQLTDGIKIFHLLKRHGAELNIKNDWSSYGITPEYLKKYSIITFNVVQSGDWFRQITFGC